MGCHVNLASAHTRPKSHTIRLLSLVHIFKGITFIIASFLSIQVALLLVSVAAIEFLLSRWLWSLRIESWGVAAGFGLFQILFPLILPISEVLFIIIVGLTIVDLVLLLQARTRGYYSFNLLAKMDPSDSWNPEPIQKSMFNLVTLAQLIKACAMYFGVYVVFSYELVNGPLAWYGIPHVPLILTLATLDLIAAIGFRNSRDWAFQLILLMAGLGFAEMILAGSIPVLLLSVWIITLLAPCWAKWAFYHGLQTRYHANNSGSSLSESRDIVEVNLATPKK